jgi:hypothetical protein
LHGQGSRLFYLILIYQYVKLYCYLFIFAIIKKVARSTNVSKEPKKDLNIDFEYFRYFFKFENATSLRQFNSYPV